MSCAYCGLRKTTSLHRADLRAAVRSAATELIVPRPVMSKWKRPRLALQAANRAAWEPLAIARDGTRRVIGRRRSEVPSRVNTSAPWPPVQNHFFRSLFEPVGEPVAAGSQRAAACRPCCRAMPGCPHHTAPAQVPPPASPRVVVMRILGTAAGGRINAEKVHRPMMNLCVLASSEPPVSRQSAINRSMSESPPMGRP